MNWIKVNNEDAFTLPPLEKVVAIIYLNDYDDSQIFALGGRTDDGEGWLWAVNSNAYGYSKNEKYNDLTADDDYRVTHWAEIKWPE